jgi:hypothetical protein
MPGAQSLAPSHAQGAALAMTMRHQTFGQHSCEHRHAAFDYPSAAISGAEYKGRMAHRFQAISETAWSPAQQHYLVCLSLSLSLVCAAQWRLASATLTTQRHAARSARMVRGVCANGLGVPRNLRPLVFVSFGGIGNRQLPAARMTCLGGSFCRAPRAQEKPLASWLSERHVRLR